MDKRVCIFCAASVKIDEKYNDAAREVVRALHALNYTVVSGGGKIGTMGAITSESVKVGGHHVAVLPAFMKGLENPDIKDVVWTETMAQRKEKMREGTRAAIALPGGVGTLEELCEVITWKQLGLFLKPIVILNVGGYYDPLLAMLESAARGHFMRPEHLKLWRVARDADEAVEEVLTTPLWDKSIGKFAQI